MFGYFLKRSVLSAIIAIIVMMFGYLCLNKLPYQLTPKVVKPIISIYTNYPNASPYEVEKEVIDRQEQQLKNLSGLSEMVSSSREGAGSINLEFNENINLKDAFVATLGKLNEVRGYPSSVSLPTIRMSGESMPPSMYLFLKSNDNDVDKSLNYFKDSILPILERIEGVGEVFYSGGRSKEIKINLDFRTLAMYSLNINSVINAINKSNTTSSAGKIEYGLNSYRVRVISDLKDRESILNIVIKSNQQEIIKLRDIASVIKTYSKLSSYNFHNNDQAIVIQIRPSADANVLELNNRIEKKVEDLNASTLKDHNLFIDTGRDERSYIINAINNLRLDIALGVLVASLILFAFLRNIYSVLLALCIIPISILGTFIIFYLLGRTINVVSLAGISFGISMIIDNSIVIIDNLQRHIKSSTTLSPSMQFKRLLFAVNEVKGALFASAITTIAIFLPILELQDTAGQLFLDVAIGVSSSIAISLIVALLLIPSFFLAVHKRFKLTIKEDNAEKARLRSFLNFTLRFKKSFIIAILVLSGAISYLSYVPISYLPNGNKNLLFAFLMPPPAISYTERSRIGERLKSELSPYLAVNNFKGNDKYPAIRDLFFYSSANYMSMGATSDDSTRIRELIPLLQNAINKIAGLSGIVVQSSIFGGSSGNAVVLNLMGNDIKKLFENAKLIKDSINNSGEKMRVRTSPSLDEDYKEINFYPDGDALAIAGLNSDEFSTLLQSILSGKNIATITDNEGIMDIILTSAMSANENISPESIGFVQIYTPNSAIVPLYSLAEIKSERGLRTIRHFERERSVALIINSREEMPLQTMLEKIQKIINPLKANLKNDGIYTSIGGSGSKLINVKSKIFGGLLLAIIITYLLLCALYENFLYPFIIILSVPLAIAGGLLGLKFLNYFTFAPLDILTMLGFIILVGSVVNNAILIVYQSLENLQNLSVKTAIVEATITRFNPIIMSMLTSVLCLLPLVVLGGDGSETYIGLAAVIIGGLVFSTLLTIIFIPCLLSLFLHNRDKL